MRSGRRYRSLLARQGRVSSTRRKSFARNWRQNLASVPDLSSYGRNWDSISSFRECHRRVWRSGMKGDVRRRMHICSAKIQATSVYSESISGRPYSRFGYEVQNISVCLPDYSLFWTRIYTRNLVHDDGHNTPVLSQLSISSDDCMNCSGKYQVAGKLYSTFESFGMSRKPLREGEEIQPGER